MFRVVITDDRFGNSHEEQVVLRGLGAEIQAYQCATEDEVSEAVREADAVLLNQAPMTAKSIAGMKRCKIISRYGIGYDNVDLVAATRKGIWVTNVPAYCVEEVAEHALGLLLACARRIPAKDRRIREGGWNLNAPIRRIAGRSLGIVGFGSTGRAFYEKALCLGLSRILVCDPRIERKLRADEFGNPASLDQVLSESDYISLHLPLNPETRHLIDAEAFAKMRQGTILINTARGHLIDEKALVEALKSGRLSAAGLDVFESEPIDPKNELLSMENVVLTDHSAYYSEEAVATLKTKAAENVREVLRGNKPRSPVNGL